jgi:3-phosphoshikimate 1-carboxyvinyltransferase
MKLMTEPGNPLLGTIELPGDKSISHRTALFAAMADGESHINNFLLAGVTRSLLNALTNLQIAWKLEDTKLTVQGRGFSGFIPPQEEIYCGNSATTMRLLTGALAATGTPCILDGSPGLRRRPMQRIVKPLLEMKVPISAGENGTAPLVLSERSISQPLRAIDYTLPVASAQVKSALLLAALGADAPTIIREPGPSRDHTERLLGGMGVQLEIGGTSEKPITTLHPLKTASLTPLKMAIPGDISAAAFLIVAALITPGSQITIKNVGLNPTRTGLLDVLLSMGGNIQISNQSQQHGEPVGDLMISHSKLQGTIISGATVVRMIDEFPIFAVAAAAAIGKTEVREAIELRHKESDRIASLCRELSILGVDIQELPDGFIINGGKIVSGGIVEPHGDHRLAMSLAVAGQMTQRPVTILGAQIIAESFPDFQESLSSLGSVFKYSDDE